MSGFGSTRLDVSSRSIFLNKLLRTVVVASRNGNPSWSPITNTSKSSSNDATAPPANWTYLVLSSVPNTRRHEPTRPSSQKYAVSRDPAAIIRLASITNPSSRYRAARVTGSADASLVKMKYGLFSELISLIASAAPGITRGPLIGTLSESIYIASNRSINSSSLICDAMLRPP